MDGNTVNYSRTQQQIVKQESVVVDPVIEAAARAIRAVFAARIGSDATAWDDLKEFQREAYREEARAALDAAKGAVLLGMTFRPSPPPQEAEQ